jgi:hypothetical protein
MQSKLRKTSAILKPGIVGQISPNLNRAVGSVMVRKVQGKKKQNLWTPYLNPKPKSKGIFELRLSSWVEMDPYMLVPGSNTGSTEVFFFLPCTFFLPSLTQHSNRYKHVIVAETDIKRFRFQANLDKAMLVVDTSRLMISGGHSWNGRIHHTVESHNGRSQVKHPPDGFEMYSERSPEVANKKRVKVINKESQRIPGRV